MAKFNYQKKAYRAECLQWDGSNTYDIVAFIEADAQLFNDEYIIIRYDGGTSTLRRGDWVIRGEDGAVRTYTDSTFEVKYEKIATN